MTFTEVLQARNIEVKKGAGRGEIRICCLFCVDNGETEDTRFRLGINIYTGKAHCFNCSWASKSNGPNLVLRKLDTDIDIEAEKEDLGNDEELPIVLPEGFEYLDPEVLKPWYHKKAIKYLRDRGMPKWQIKAKKIGVTIVGNFGYRIIFPVAFNKELVGLVGRGWAKSCKPKYLNSVGDKWLYNLPTNKKISDLVLSEGIFKCLAIERHLAIPSAALLGHDLTDIHFKQLEEYKHLKSILVWSDPDKVGIKGTIKICQKLKEAGYNKVYVCITDKQADELTSEQLRLAYNKQALFSDFIEQKLQVKAAFL